MPKSEDIISFISHITVYRVSAYIIHGVHSAILLHHFCSSVYLSVRLSVCLSVCPVPVLCLDE